MVETQEKPSPPERWLPLARACQLLGVNASTLRQWADRGQVRAFRTPGGHRRFSSEDLQVLLERTARGQVPAGGHPPSLSDSALRRIRRRLHGERTASFPWHERLDEATRGRMRLYGRRLLDLTEAYLSQRRRRQDLLEEVRLIGQEYGEELGRQKLSLRDVLEAFLFFRHSLLGTVRDTAHNTLMQGEEVIQAWQHVEVLASELLLCMAEAYERSRDAAILPVS